MKKLYCLLIILSAVALVNAQTVLTFEDHAPQPGDQHHFVISQNVAAGSEGVAQVWDFSHLNQKNELISTMHQTDQSVEGASMYINEFRNKFYFRVNESIVEEFGIVSCGNNTIQLEKPAVKMVFPFRYGDVYENEFHGYTMAGERRVDIVGTDQHEADAYGTLILPGDVEVPNVLRLKSTRTRIYGSCNNASTTTTYRWYAQDVRYPLLTIIKQENGEQSKYIRTAYHAKAKEALDKARERKQESKGGISTAKLGNTDVAVEIFPSPFESYFDIHYRINEKTEVVIALFNNNGQKIRSENMGIQEPGEYVHRINNLDESLSSEMLFINVVTDYEVINTKVVKSK